MKRVEYEKTLIILFVVVSNILFELLQVLVSQGKLNIDMLSPQQMLLLGNNLLSKARKKSYVLRNLVEDMLKFLHEKLLEVKNESWNDEGHMRNAFNRLKVGAMNFEEKIAKFVE